MQAQVWWIERSGELLFAVHDWSTLSRKCRLINRFRHNQDMDCTRGRCHSISTLVSGTQHEQKEPKKKEEQRCSVWRRGEQRAPHCSTTVEEEEEERNWDESWLEGSGSGVWQVRGGQKEVKEPKQQKRGGGGWRRWSWRQASLSAAEVPVGGRCDARALLWLKRWHRCVGMATKGCDLCLLLQRKRLMYEEWSNAVIAL